MFSRTLNFLKFSRSLDVQTEHFQWANPDEIFRAAVLGTSSIFYQFSALSDKRHQSYGFFFGRHKKYVRRRRCLDQNIILFDKANLKIKIKIHLVLWLKGTYIYKKNDTLINIYTKRQIVHLK